jgi:hypothetical protein
MANAIAEGVPPQVYEPACSLAASVGGKVAGWAGGKAGQIVDYTKDAIGEGAEYVGDKIGAGLSALNPFD